MRILTVFTLFSVALILIPALSQAQGTGRYFPTKARMKQACAVSGGQWDEIPAYCDHMHPRTWPKLSAEQKEICQNRFDTPCYCGPGMRFTVRGVIGCVKSRFAEDQHPQRR